MDRHVERGLDRGREPGPTRPGEKSADGGSSSSLRTPMGESARSSAAASVQNLLFGADYFVIGLTYQPAGGFLYFR